MKRIALCILALICCITFAEAQTYYYKFTSEVDPETDVRSSYSGDFYLTFTNNQNVCYQSDKNGNQISESGRRNEFGKTGATGRSGFTTLTTYGAFGPIVSAPIPAAIYRKCDGVFKYTQTTNEMVEYKCYYYDYYFGNMKKVDDGYIYIYFSKDLKKINVKNANQYGKGGILVGERAVMPGEKRRLPNCINSQLRDKSRSFCDKYKYLFLLKLPGAKSFLAMILLLLQRF